MYRHMHRANINAIPEMLLLVVGGRIIRSGKAVFSLELDELQPIFLLFLLCCCFTVFFISGT